MFKQEDVPTVLWPEAQVLNDKIRDLSFRTKRLQELCKHTWVKVTWRDPEYCARVDGEGRGSFTVIKGYRCSECHAYRPIEGSPSRVCRICGVEMVFDHFEQCGMDRVHVSKCRGCGHEHDTT